MRKISFILPSDSTKYLISLIRSDCTNKYNWYVINGQTEIYIKYFDAIDFSGIYKTDELIDIIGSNNCVNFLKVQGYNNYNNYSNVESYSDFLDGACETILLIYDSVYFEAYSKDSNYLESLKAIAHKIKCKNIKCIECEDDDRYSMNIL